MGWTSIKWDDALLAAAKRGLARAGMIIEGQAVHLCPVGQYNTGKVGGRLRSSITWAIRSNRTDPKGTQSQPNDGVSTPADDYTLHVGTNVEYAPYVEYGTRRWPTGQPFLRPAMDITRDRVCSDFAAQISKVLKERAGGKNG